MIVFGCIGIENILEICLWNIFDIFDLKVLFKIFNIYVNNVYFDVYLNVIECFFNIVLINGKYYFVIYRIY